MWGGESESLVGGWRNGRKGERRFGGVGRGGEPRAEERNWNGRGRDSLASLTCAFWVSLCAEQSSRREGGRVARLGKKQPVARPAYKRLPPRRGLRHLFHVRRRRVASTPCPVCRWAQQNDVGAVRDRWNLVGYFYLVAAFLRSGGSIRAARGVVRLFVLQPWLEPTGQTTRRAGLSGARLYLSLSPKSATHT